LDHFFDVKTEDANLCDRTFCSNCNIFSKYLLYYNRSDLKIGRFFFNNTLSNRIYIYTFVFYITVNFFSRV
jgi:hypothetical protein